MLSLIGTVVGMYVVARMIELFFRKPSPNSFVLVVLLLTGIVAFILTVIIATGGGSTPKISP